MAKISQIIIGDELLNAKINDLNLNILASAIYPLGLDFKKSTILGDKFDQVKDEIILQSKSNDVVIITGGLGPTKDDLTKSIIAAALGVELTHNADSEKMAINGYARYGKDWNPEISHYHMMPDGTTPILNEVGLAPGIWGELNGCQIISAPGVPSEFKAMLKNQIIPKLSDLSTQSQEIFNIRTHSIPEEVIFFEKCPTLWEELSVFAKVSSLPTISGVDITLSLKKEHQNQESKNKIKEIMNASAISANVWHYGLESIEEVIVKRMSEKGLTLGFAESCTGGLAASTITDVSGSSSIFWGSVVSYANSVKENQLGVKEQTLKDHGAVSIEVAKEMAQGAKDNLGVDYAISYTGIAGPGGGSEEKPVGTVCIGIATPQGSESFRFNFRGNRARLKKKFCQEGLKLLLQAIT